MSLDSVRVVVRTLAKQRGFTVVVVLSLALAIALNTTMYGVLDALIQPRVDIRRPNDVYTVRMYGDYRNHVSRQQREQALREGMHHVEAIAWFNPVSSSWRGTLFEAGTNLLEGSVTAVSPEYFDLIGPRVLAGRTFVAADAEETESPIVLSEAAAEQLFPNRTAVGQDVTVGDSTFRVIGVLSRYSDFPESRSTAWKLGKPAEKEMLSRVIRLRPGSSADDAQRELDLVAQRIALAAGDDPKEVAFRFHRPAAPQFHVRGFHIALILAVVAVLLVACANLANMQLARGIARRRELALRTALGATRRRIITHLLTESVLLASGGLVLGLVLTYVCSALLRASIPPSVGDYVVEPQISWRVLVFALIATASCVLLIGVAPAIRVSRVDPNEMLKSGAGTGATRRHRRQYGYLVAAEIALALGLLSGASMMVRSAMHLETDELAFDPMPLVTAFAPASLLQRTGRVTQSEILEITAKRAAAVAGVAAAAAYTTNGVEGNAVTISDSARGLREIPAPSYNYRVVSTDYLRTWGLRIVRGRNFEAGERDAGAVIIDEYTASNLWPNGNPIGAMMKFGDSKSKRPFVRVVGVAAMITKRRFGMPTTNENRMGSVYYLPGAFDSTTVGASRAAVGGGAAGITVRTNGPVIRLPLALRRAGFVSPRPMGADVIRERASKQFIAQLFTLFAALGLGLAAFGVYGVVAHSVAERRRELGVRIALGATSRHVLHAVLRESVIIGLSGVALGLLATKRSAFLLSAFALPDDVYNAPLFAGAALFLLTAAAVSAYIPALRATRVDPTDSLRSE